MSAQPESPRFPFPPSPVPYDPGPEMRELMAKCPVNKVRLPDDSSAWLVTGFEETREVVIDQRYSRALVFAPEREVYGMEAMLADAIIAMDPPEHTRLRKLVAGAVAVDTRLCIGSGMCVGTAPDRFRFDDSGHSSPVRTQPPC